MTNKEIYKIKLSLTTGCNLDCDYCFVEKTRERMSYTVAKESVDLLLNSPGREKLLAMYGGEPFLEFELLKKIVVYARKAAREKHKKLIISIATNLTILTAELVRLIKKHDLKITVSLVGPAAVHDKFRHFVKGKGSHRKVLRNLQELSREIPRENIGISFVLMPQTSHRIYNNFKYILDLGVTDYINFEIIQESVRWSEKQRENFKKNYKKIVLEVVRMIAEGKRNIFLNSISWEFVHNILTEKLSIGCPFKQSLEVYPAGDMAFSPFLLNRKDKDDFIIGNVRKGIDKEYAGCRFSPDSGDCLTCEKKYYDKVDNNRDFAFLVKRYYESASLEMAKVIREKAKTSRQFKKYAGEIKKFKCF